MQGYTLDTNIITGLMNRNAKIATALKNAVKSGFYVTMNAISYYEIKRGLEKIQRIDKLDQFEKICRDIGILFIDEKAILDHASSTWAELTKKGSPIGDADILIAAIAIVKDYTLVTNNKSHFERIPDLSIDDWM